MRIAKLLLWCGVGYGILLILIRGVVPLQSSPKLFLLALPLIAMAIIITRDLARRSTSPAVKDITQARLSGLKDTPVLFLSGQIRVAADASDSYFENIIRSRLKELLVSKVSLELGIERDTIRIVLSNPKQGLPLLHSEKLYSILYGRAPRTGLERMQIINEAIDMIGEWTG